MNDRVRSFMSDWADENVIPTGYPQEDVPDPEAELLANQCVAAATEQDITRKDLEQEYGDLAAYMHRCLDSAADAEVKRKADKDD